MAIDSLEGQNLGKYRVLEPLGRGGMARVYRAYHPQLDRYVAIKVLRSDLVEETEFLARFQREARAVAGLRHPNIVQVFDFDAREDIYYMVMELLEGDTLHRRLDDYRAREERMPLGEALRIVLDVLDGLEYAHSEGMIHRDVKPANILLTRKGEAVLTDFGIAQIVGGTRHTVSGALMGTLSYMAPEQAMEGQCDARSDIYSLGIVLYEMLTGEPPFDAETPLAILLKHVNDPLPLPRTRAPDLPAPIERVVLKALAKRRQDRYESAAQMAAAVRSAAEAAGVSLPGRISPPLSFTTTQAPSESVAVLTGAERQKAVAAQAAAEDTDASISEKLAAIRSNLAPQPVPAPVVAAAVAGVGTSASSAQPAGSGVHIDLQVDLPSDELDKRRRSVGMSILLGLALIVVGNVSVVFGSLVSNRWGMYERGWPFELLLVGLALALIIQSNGSPWLVFPAGVLLGNGYLMAFYALTDAWTWWTWLWPLELVVVFGAAALAIHLYNDGREGRDRARHMAIRVMRPTLMAAVILVMLGLVFG
ncbi:MAG: serine/threonine protein kinase [Anaerolineae bacterium]|nr:serine/threonine protein kinase [Anaerolineae bacterium]